MTKKDIAFIKKIIGNSEYTPVMRIVSCYVNIDQNDIRFQEPQTFLRLYIKGRRYKSTGSCNFSIT